jgi:uncharacterized SAM-binding protein YcdF (DUF218 family)
MIHYFAAVIVSQLLSPFNWIVILVITAFLVKQKQFKKVILYSALVIFILFGNPFLFNLYAKKWQPAPNSIAEQSTYSCGIVAGGFASPDADASGYFNTSADRFIQVLRLYKTGVIKNILVSGGNGKEDQCQFNEGSWVKGQLKEMGVPDSVILVEDKSRNTEENAINSKNILDSLHLKPPYLLITSAYHVPRATEIFQKANLQVIPFPCNYTDGRGKTDFWDIIPRFSVLFGWETYLKETAGYFWYKMK